MGVAALLDTSIFVALESGRPIASFPDDGAISAMTLAELHLGVLMAPGERIRARRLRTLSWVENAFDALVFDEIVARRCAELQRLSRRRGRKRLNAADAVIAATAVVNGLPLYTQDADFDGLPGLEVVRV